MGRVSPFHEAISDITTKYPHITHSIVVDEHTFAPILGFAYGDIRVSKKLSRVEMMDQDYQYWIDKLEELILPIKRELTINNIINDNE